VVNVSNSPSFADDPVMEFFRTSTTNLLEYSAKALRPTAAATGAIEQEARVLRKALGTVVARGRVDGERGSLPNRAFDGAAPGRRLSPARVVRSFSCGRLAGGGVNGGSGQ
jgi:hypothetical protein